MSKHYFLTVRTYQSVNNMGLELGRYVEKKYHNVVVSAEDFGKVTVDIMEKMKELEKKYPRSKAFKMETLSSKDRYQQNAPSIYVTPQSKYNDNHVFVLNTAVIRNEVNVVSLSTKGNEQ
ncbi:MAG: hypothetical protein J6W38_04765 [Prevotella sp.]|nr:hypothetical protein [Prevotella sp.]